MRSQKFLSLLLSTFVAVAYNGQFAFAAKPNTTPPQSVSSNTSGNANGGGNNGGGDNSDGDNSDGDTSIQPKPEVELRSKLEPIFYLDFDITRKIINRTLHDSSKANNQTITYDFNPNRESLILGDYQDGFTVVDYHLIEGGIGLRAKLFYENASGLKELFYAYAGIIPYAGKDMMTVRYANTLAAAKKMPRFSNPPETADDLANWSLGDSMTYESTGGVMFIAGAGFSLIGVSGAKIAKGTWKVYVEKTDIQTAYVKITKNKLDSLSGHVGGVLVSIGTGEFKSSDDGFSYKLDLTSQTGRQAFADLLSGNVLGVQMLEQNQDPSVLHVDNFKITSAGKFNNFFLGLPLILNTNWSSGNIYSFEATDMIIDQKKAQAHYGVYSKDRQTRVFATKRSRTYTFYGADYSVTDSQNQVLNGQFGHFIWSYHNEDSSQSSLRKAMKELVRQVGLQNLVLVNIPSNDDLNYTGLNFEVSFDQNQTDRMIRAAQLQGFVAWKEQGSKALNTYFKTTEDRLGLCENFSSTNNDNFGTADAAEDIRKRCYSYYKSGGIGEDGTLEAIEKMHQALREMGTAKGSNSEIFVKAYAKFGKAALTNPFTFNKALELAGTGVELTYTVEGEKLSAYEIGVATTGKSGEFKVIKSPGEPLKNRNRHGRIENERTRGVIIAPSRPIIETPLLPAIGQR